METESKYGKNEWVVRVIYATGFTVDKNPLAGSEDYERDARAIYADVVPEWEQKGRQIGQVVQRVADRRFIGGFRMERIRTVDHIVRVELLHDYVVVEAKGCDAETAKKIILAAYLHDLASRISFKEYAYGNPKMVQCIDLDTPQENDA